MFSPTSSASNAPFAHDNDLTVNTTRPMTSSAGIPSGGTGFSHTHSAGPGTTEENTARLCRIGQELVHEIVQKATDIFQVLKSTQLPYQGSAYSQMLSERQKHVQDTMKMILTYFKQLKLVYTTVTENCSHMPLQPVQDLIPLAGRDPPSVPDLSNDEAYKAVEAEHHHLTEQLKLRNSNLKEVIDQLRWLLWEVNAMMSMRNNKLR